MADRVGLRWLQYRDVGGRFAERAQPALDRTLGELRTSLLEVARREAPISRAGDRPPGAPPPGRLRRELRVQQTREGLRGTLVLDSPTPYARWVLGGRGEVRPVNRRFLRFWIRGRLVFARRVRGVPPNPYIQRAFEAWWPQAQGPLGRLVGRLTAQLTEE
jgi:hypothetical protein